MRKTYNILFSTTRQWNPGDEFIQMGIENIIDSLGVIYNKFILNRNPDITPKYQIIPYQIRHKLCKTRIGSSIFGSIIKNCFDNSIKENIDINMFDTIIVSGTPEWFGRRYVWLFKKALKNNVQLNFVGIGYGGDKVDLEKRIKRDKLLKKVISKANLIITRDKKTFEVLYSYRKNNTYYLPCPALFSSRLEKNIKKIKKIGLVFQTKKAPFANRINEELYSLITKVYMNLAKKDKRHQLAFIAHYIEDFNDLFGLLRRNEIFSNIYYSYNSSDYIDIYKQFDLIITPRVHGAGLASSLGIPSLYIPHDKRWDTVLGFKSKVLRNFNENNLISTIDHYQDIVKRINKELIKYKKEKFRIYKKILKQQIFQAL